MVLGQLITHMQKNEVRPLLPTIFKNKLKMDQRHTYKTLKPQKILEETQLNLRNLGFSNGFLKMTMKAKATTTK